MIALPELAVVLGVIALMVGYVFVLRYMLSHAEDEYPDSTKKDTRRPG